jgi:hypothetical protein
MTIYAEVVGGSTATELPQGAAFALSTGEQLAGNWLDIASQAEREALNIYPITDDATPGFEYTVTGSTLEVGGGGVTVQRHWTTTAKTAVQMKDEEHAEIEEILATLIEYDLNVTVSAGNHNFDALVVSQTAIALHAAAAARAIEGGALPTELDWFSGVTTFVWPNTLDGDVEIDAFDMLLIAQALADFLRMINKWRRHFRTQANEASDTDDIPRLLTNRINYQNLANWTVAWP